MTRRTLAAPLLAVTAFVTACSRAEAPTTPVADGSASIAATFNSMGDSVIASGGSTEDAAPFYGAAGLAALSPNVTSLMIDVDGTPTKFDGLAVATEIFGGPLFACPLPLVGSGMAAPFVCPWGVPRVTRTLFAWSPTRPMQIVTLVASVDSGPIGTPIPIFVPGTATPMGVGTTTGSMLDSAHAIAPVLLRPIPAHLEYSDGKRGMWWGTSGTQMNTVKPNGASCAPPPTSTAAAPRPNAIPPSRCQLADFTFSFSGTVSRPPIALRGNNGSGTHALQMGPVAMTGLYLKLGVPIAATAQ